MDITNIILIILTCIIITAVIYLYRQINNISTNIKNNIPIDNLKVKNLEIIETLKTPNDLKIDNLEIKNLKTENINSIDEKININNDLILNSNNINFKPYVSVDTSFNVEDDINKYTSLPDTVYITNEDNNVNMKILVNDLIYSYYNNHKNKFNKEQKEEEKQKETFISIPYSYY